MNTSDLPDQLKRAMTTAGLVDPRRDTPSLSAWGREAGVHTSTISKYVQGGNAHPSSVRKMADALGVSVSELSSMTGRGSQEPWTPPSGTERLTVRQRAALNELIASFTDTQGEGHDRQDEAEPGQETRRPQHSSPSRTEDGSTPQRSGAPISDDLEQQRKKKRIADDPAAFGDQARRGDLDYRHQQEHASLAADTDEAAGRTTSEGVRQWEHADTLGEESQDPGDHHES